MVNLIQPIHDRITNQHQMEAAMNDFTFDYLPVEPFSKSESTHAILPFRVSS
jgi:hypothetical protein